MIHMLANFITEASPIIASALLGPAGKVITGLIADIFKANSSDVTDIISKIQSDPDGHSKIQNLETHIGVLTALTNKPILSEGFLNYLSGFSKPTEVDIAIKLKF